jgi:hypothetical protein
LQFAQANTQSKIAKELTLPTQTKLFLKNFHRFKKNKNTPTHSPTNTADNDKKLNNDKAYSEKKKRGQQVTHA